MLLKKGVPESSNENSAQNETSQSTQEENNVPENTRDENKALEITREENRVSQDQQEENKVSQNTQEEPSPVTIERALNSEQDKNLYSEFESLYESVLFKKPDLLTNKVFVNAMNEIKDMKININPVQFQKDLTQIDELLDKLYRTVQANFAKLDKESLAKILINVKDKLQSKKPEESVGKIAKILTDYITKETTVTEKEKEKPKTGKMKKD